MGVFGVLHQNPLTQEERRIFEPENPVSITRNCGVIVQSSAGHVSLGTI